MTIEFKMPDIGEGVAEGEIVRWLVAEGQTVKEDQPMVEVMTDKATVEITSPANATIASILHPEGAVVPVHSVIVILDDGGGGSSSTPAPSAAAASAAVATPATAPVRATGGKVLAAPATRKLARDLGVDLTAVSGTGPKGRVTRQDVEAASRGAPAPTPAPAVTAPVKAAPPPPPPPATPPATPKFDSAGEERIPYRGLRRAVGDQMVRSAFSAPHFTIVEEVDMTDLWRARKGLAELGAEKGIKFTFLPIIIRALVSAIRRYPSINAHMDTDGGEIIVRRDVHVGIATDTDRGLVVPVVKHADRRTLMEVAADIQHLAEGGRAGTLNRDQLTGSTITITSAGSIGGLFATPILNHPEVAILGVYQIQQKPVIRDGAIVIGRVGYLSLTLDHRVVDGGTAARVLSYMKKALESPHLLLAET